MCVLNQVKQAGGSDAWFVDALCASAEYESFVELMEGMVLVCRVVDSLELSLLFTLWCMLQGW